MIFVFFFFKQKTAYEMRISDWSSDVCSSDLVEVTGQEMAMLIQQAAQQYRPEDRDRFVEYIRNEPMAAAQLRAPLYEDKVVDFLFGKAEEIGRASGRERGCQYV